MLAPHNPKTGNLSRHRHALASDLSFRSDLSLMSAPSETAQTVALRPQDAAQRWLMPMAAVLL